MIPAYVMAVPWDVQRAKRAASLRTEADATVVWDEKQNAMDTFRLVLQRVIDDELETGFILLQDDVQLTENWRWKIEQAIADHPSAVIQFFSMNKNDVGKESDWRDGKTFISNLCVHFPKGLAGELLSYSYYFVEKYPKFKTADDFVVRYWLRDARERFWMHLPSLVQHERWVSSIHEKRPRNRVSQTFEEA